jgi:hypothetical protein
LVDEKQPWKKALQAESAAENEESSILSLVQNKNENMSVHSDSQVMPDVV